MVKLAQHIEWSSPIPSKAGEGAPSSTERKRSDRVPADGKPRKTLAQLFESRGATPSSSSKSAPSSALPSPASSAMAATAAASLSSRTASSLSTSSSASSATPPSATAAPPSQMKPTPSATSSAPLRKSPRTPFPPTAHAHVTFVENVSGKYHKHAQTTEARERSELACSIKRSSSARKIADSIRHEGASLRSNNIVKRLSVSGPLGRSEPSPRSPLTNAGNSDRSNGSDPAKLISRQNGRPNVNLPKKSLFGQERLQLSSVAANLGKLEQKTRSPFAKFRIHEHYQTAFLQKSIDAVESLQSRSRYRQKETDRYLDKGSNAEHTILDDLRREKKVRKGLFGLLPDASMGKDVGGESKVADAMTWKVSGDLEKAANIQDAGSKLQDTRNPPVRLPKANRIVVSSQTEQYPGRKISKNMSMLCEARESTYTEVEIPDRMVGLAWIGAEPRLLAPGSYTFPSDEFALKQVVSEQTRYLKHGILHRLYIDKGHLGVAWVDGKAILVEAGVSVHVAPSNKFSYITTDEKMLSEKEFVLGPFRVVTVDESEVGIKFCNRLPQILYPGRHCLSISKVEVFAGFESLLRRQSHVSGASAISRDNMKVCADACVEWQIKAEDAAATRLANITNVEEAVCCKVRRAFTLTVGDVNAHGMKLQLTTGAGSMNNSDPPPLLKSLSSNVLRECQELFEEGWTVTIWDLELKHIVIQPEVQDTDGKDST